VLTGLKEQRQHLQQQLDKVKAFLSPDGAPPPSQAATPAPRKKQLSPRGPQTHRSSTKEKVGGCAQRQQNRQEKTVAPGRDLVSSATCNRAPELTPR
jgi:hypothetical protein